MKKILTLIIMLLFIGLSIPSSSIDNSYGKSYVNLLYSPHAPIYINGNENFTSENGVGDGSGTILDPYIISGWKINASSRDGITLRNVNVFFKIRYCSVFGGGINNDGIVFYNVTNGNIEYSTITKNRYGIIFRANYQGYQNSSRNFIHHNNITYNNKDGIHFQHIGWPHHSYNLIYRNNIIGNRRGIYMVMSANNQIFKNNIIANSEWGVNLTKCIGGGIHNKIYHNNFLENGEDGRQACSRWTIDNDWDDGYPSGGNFWSDYDGIDNFSGPNQNITGSDGIGDKPYSIKTFDEWEYDYDYYPLMEIFGNLPPIIPFAKFYWTPSLPYQNETILFNASESIDYDGNITLYEWDWDDDGIFDENHTNNTATHSWTEYGYYPVNLRVTDNDNLTNSITKIIRVGNLPPYEPSNPDPTGIVTHPNVILSWDGGDPDSNDNVTYYVYLIDNYPELVGIVGPYPANKKRIYFELGPLTNYKTYYWMITAVDNHNVSTNGPEWTFTLAYNTPPNPPLMEGPTSGKNGVTYEYTITATDPDGDDVIYGFINWGDNTSSGWLGPCNFTAGYTVSHQWDKKGTYTISAIVQDIHGDESDWGTLKVTMPKNKNTWIHRWLERFPLLNQLITRIMERWSL